MTDLDILCFGEPLGELNEQSDGRYLAGFGGDTSNCAIAAARSGAAVGMLAHVGSDTFGERFMKLWCSEGVDTSCVVQSDDAPTGIYLVTHDDNGHQFSYWRQGSAASRVTAADVDPDAITRSRILHVSGISQAISASASDAVFFAIETAQAQGVQVSYDSNLRLQLWPLARARAIIHAAMTHCDWALPGFDDACLLTGLSTAEAIVDFYLGLGAKCVALTLGERGTLVATGDKTELVPAFPVTAVDATAAGDTFDGAFLAEVARGANPFSAALYANAAAALSTQGFGAVAPMPDRAQVQALLEAMGR